MNSDNARVLIFLTIMTVVVALVLSGFRQATAEQAALNEEIFNIRAMLSSVADYLGEDVALDELTDAQVMQIFDEQIQKQALDTEGNIVETIEATDIDLAKERKKPIAERVLPFYTFMNGGEKYYILAVRGSGLWDEIWGHIALKSDLSTIAGASFDHKGETPGLGAEIKDNPRFAANFKGDKIYDGDQLVGINVKKGGADPSNEHAVDGISGATVTADGVEDMIWIGLQMYQPYLEKLRAE